MDIKRITGLHPTRVTIILAELIEQGFLQKTALEGSQVYQTLPNKKLSQLNLQRYRIQAQVKREELDRMLEFAEHKVEQGNEKRPCRMQLLRQALGDVTAPTCGRCDLCQEILPVPLPSAASASDYLLKRATPIAAMKRERLSQGFSLFSSQLRTPPFLDFMYTRRLKETVDPDILSLLVENILKLQVNLNGIIILPSRTWKAQIALAEALAKSLKLPLLPHLLTWAVMPPKRQGELFNNDQRQENVHKKMAATMSLKTTSRPWLILDDYIGSGATLREAARALRQVTNDPLIPVTIASVTWKLGKSGF